MAVGSVTESLLIQLQSIRVATFGADAGPVLNTISREVFASLLALPPSALTNIPDAAQIPGH